MEKAEKLFGTEYELTPEMIRFANRVNDVSEWECDEGVNPWGIDHGNYYRIFWCGDTAFGVRKIA